MTTTTRKRGVTRTGRFGTLMVLGMGLGMLTMTGAVHAGSCTVSSSGLAFGAYQPLTFAGKLTSADKTSTATVSLVCTGITTGGAYAIKLGPDNFGGVSSRYLRNDSSPGTAPYMLYNIYTDFNYGTIWGDGITGGLLTGTVPTGDSTTITLPPQTVYGKIPAGQNTLRVGNYSGSLVMTVTFNP